MSWIIISAGNCQFDCLFNRLFRLTTKNTPLLALVRDSINGPWIPWTSGPSDAEIVYISWVSVIIQPNISNPESSLMLTLSHDFHTMIALYSIGSIFQYIYNFLYFTLFWPYHKSCHFQSIYEPICFRVASLALGATIWLPQSQWSNPERYGYNQWVFDFKEKKCECVHIS